MSVKTLKDLLAEGVSGRAVLVRSDFNVPLDGDKITDPGRIIASLPTLNALIDAGAKVVIAAHLGRPKGSPDPKYSLAPVAERLGEELGRNVQLAADVVGPDALARAEGLTDGDVLLLENVRFDARETSKVDSERESMAKQLAELVGDDGAFVSDGFGVVHRKQASVYDVAKLLPHAAGDLVKREVDVMAGLIKDPARPFVVVLGGAKVADKLAVIDNLLNVADTLVIGGGMVFTFLVAEGHEVGTSKVDTDSIEACKGYLARAKELGKKIVLPVDIRVSDGMDFETMTLKGKVEVVPADDMPADKAGLDIGPESEKLFAKIISEAGSVFWNGPMGVFEVPEFAEGTRAVAQALTQVKGMSVVGGGDSASAVRALGFDESAFGHISTGGGASLEFMEGKELPGVAVLEEDA